MGSRAALPHLISWTNSSLLLCLQTVQFLDGAGGNKPHYIAVCIGTALLSRERPWLPSCLAACHCEVLPSVGAQIPPVQTGAPTQVASCVKMFAPLFLSLLVLLFVPTLCSCLYLPCHLLVHTHAFLPYTQHNPSMSLTGSAVWEDGGDGRWCLALQPVHGSKLNSPECPGSLHEADQWDFPQWGHEGHVRLI